MSSIRRVAPAHPAYRILRRFFIEEGDTVTVGKRGAVHWVVDDVVFLFIDHKEVVLANLRSGLSGRRIYSVPVRDLTIFQKGIAE